MITRVGVLYYSPAHRQWVVSYQAGGKHLLMMHAEKNELIRQWKAKFPQAVLMEG